MRFNVAENRLSHTHSTHTDRMFILKTKIAIYFEPSWIGQHSVVPESISKAANTPRPEMHLFYHHGWDPMRKKKLAFVRLASNHRRWFYSQNIILITLFGFGVRIKNEETVRKIIQESCGHLHNSSKLPSFEYAEKIWIRTIIILVQRPKTKCRYANAAAIIVLCR